MDSLRSLGYRSDLLVLSYQGEIIDHGDVIQAITPDNPGYQWGNLLVFRSPPQPGDEQRWVQRFRSLFAAHPKVRHVSLGWDELTGATATLGPFAAAGFAIEELAVMTATQEQLTPPPKVTPEVEVKILQTDQEWAEATALQVTCGKEFFPEGNYEVFKQKQMNAHRQNSEAGHGHWYGAYLDGRLVADLGIYHGGGIARFQNVETHPQYRRQGIASALVWSASQRALALHQIHTLVIVAHNGAPAMRMYEGVGYRTTERQVGLCKSPPTDDQVKADRL